MNLTVDEIHKMKVVELKAELQLRGLDPKGVKAVLVDRLISALGGTPVGNGNNAFVSSKDDDEQEESEDVVMGSPKRSTSPVKASSAVKQLTPTNMNVPQLAAAPAPTTPTPTMQSPPIAATTTTQPTNNATPPVSPVKAVVSASAVVSLSPIKITSPIKPPVVVTQTPPPTVSATVGSVVTQENVTPVEAPEKDTTADEGVVTMDTTSDSAAANKRKLEDDTTATETKQEVKKVKTEHVHVPKIVPENEPAFDEDALLLDWYKSDLNLKISKENFLEAEPIVSDDFPFAYGGAKGTYGFSSGKVFYEVKFVKAIDVRADFGDLEFKHILRTGWSDLLTDLQLGQEKFSYGYESKSKIYKGGEISEFGENLAEGDVVGVYLEIGDEFVEMKFTKNGTLVGDTVQIPKAEVEGKVWFPHVLVRNVKFSVNFGASEPAHPPLEGYTFVGKVEPSPSRVRGPQRPEKKDECELIMLVGLACSGKTTWAKEYVKNNPEKNYIILGTSTVVERSVKDPSIITAPKGPKAYEGFMNRAGKFVEKLVDTASSRRRNYILDQSNVLPSVQRRKCGGFQGFRRRAVVICPTDEEYQKRIKTKEQEQGKSVPKSTILEMKSSFQLPEVGELFSEVEFPENPKAEAEKLVTTYNKEGVDAGYGRSGSGRGNQRGGFHGRGRGFMQRGRGGGFNRGGPRGGGRGGGMMMRGPPRPPMRGGGPPMRGNGPPMRVMRDPGFRGGRGMGPPPMRGGPPMNGNSRFGGPPNRGPRGGGPPLQRGGGGGSWQRASGMPMGNGQRAPPRPQHPGGRGGGPGRWGSSPKPMNSNNSRAPQVWQQQAPPQQQQQSVWNTGNGFNNFGGGQQQQPQQFIDPWVQHQQVPDQGFGRSWDSGNNNNMNMQQHNNMNRGGGGGTWQGYYGGQGQQGGGYRR